MTGWLSCIFLVPMECVVVAFADTLENKCAEYSVEDVASSSCLLLLETRPMPRAWICTVRWEAHGRRTDKKERARISLSIYVAS